MRKNIYKILLLNIFIFLISCAPGNSQRSHSGGSKDSYQEDLSGYRPKYGVDSTSKNTPAEKIPLPKSDVTKSLNAKLDTIAVRNQKIKLANGYRILVYAGNSSLEANKAKEKVLSILPDEKIYPQYKQPTFRVKVGDYFNRIEANNRFIMLMKDFPNAMVVPDQVNIIKEEIKR